MKKNGFTLIELVVTILIFSMIMLGAVPNIVSMVDKNKRVSYIEDAKKFVKLARYKFYTTTIDVNHPNNGRPNSSTYNCFLYRLTSVDNTSFSPPNEGEYLTDRSYVAVRYDTTHKKYIFHVQLVEKYVTGGKTYYRGVTDGSTATNLYGLDSDNLNLEVAKRDYVKAASTSISLYRSINSGVLRSYCKFK